MERAEVEGRFDVDWHPGLFVLAGSGCILEDKNWIYHRGKWKREGGVVYAQKIGSQRKRGDGRGHRVWRWTGVSHREKGYVSHY